MKIYVGYVIINYATAVCMSTNKSAVKKKLAKINATTEYNTFIKSYDVENGFIDFDW